MGEGENLGREGLLLPFIELTLVKEMKMSVVDIFRCFKLQQLFLVLHKLNDQKSSTMPWSYLFTLKIFRRYIFLSFNCMCADIQ